MHDLVACDLCQRTILKGERIETFVAGGEPHRVCELCNMRALRSGWQRQAELERHAPDRDQVRPHRSLWSRAVTWAEEQGLWGAPPPAVDHEAAASPELAHARPPAAAPAPRPRRPADPHATRPRGDSTRSSSGSGEQADAAPGAGLRETLPEHLSAARDRAEQRRRARHDENSWNGEELIADGGDADAASVARRPARTPAAAAGLRDFIAGRRRESRAASDVPTSRWGKIELALELFNASEHRRTITGIGRALGEPWVSAAPLEEDTVAREVGIVVAWELSWYRYRVDLGAEDIDQIVLLLDRGNEVDDIDQAMRQWNVSADAEGRLVLAVEAVS